MIVAAAKTYERVLGGMFSGHICVTHAMSRWLKDNWGIVATVLHDKPPAFFHRCSISERHALHDRIKSSLSIPESSSTNPLGFRRYKDILNSKDKNLFTELLASGVVEDRLNRPAIIVSSTSWTPDEDFSILLDAVVQLDNDIREDSTMPNMIFIITGKGPEKAHYVDVIKSLDLRRCCILTMWLEMGDYPLLLGSADLGVCLHTSSSGLDLPMKVVDMFGAALPVCAVSFSCLHELVKDGENGLVFHNSTQLKEQLLDLFTGFPSKSNKLSKLAEGTAAFRESRWEDNWRAKVKYLFE
jgi:beta-1,4-mannosyltransferase